FLQDFRSFRSFRSFGAGISADETHVNQRLLAFLRGWNEINRRGGGPPVAAAFLLLGFCVLSHIGAFLKLALGYAYADDRTMHEIAVIQFVHSNPWVAIFFGAILLASMIWLERCSSPQWTVWLAFGLLAVPCFVYARAC